MRDWIPQNPYAPFDIEELPKSLYDAIVKLPDERVEEILNDENEMIKFSMKNGYNFISQEDYDEDDEDEDRRFVRRGGFYD